MFSRRRFSRGRTLDRTANAINLSAGLKRGGLSGLIVGGAYGALKFKTAKSGLDIIDAFGGVIGGILIGVPAIELGIKLDNRIKGQLIGKPRVCRRIASQIKDGKKRMFVRALGNIDYSNQSIRDSLRAVYVTGNATRWEQNIVDRELKKAMKKAEMQEALDIG